MTETRIEDEHAALTGPHAVSSGMRASDARLTHASSINCFHVYTSQPDLFPLLHRCVKIKSQGPEDSRGPEYIVEITHGKRLNVPEFTLYLLPINVFAHT
ncbi:hypothetical protein Y032_0043g769 [Ancylostoma ceylanicum]|uniref:Uncharacterized protein n=1 Tax=Ancylostoma ceylanicum TaxID=53326 RepID=A0A016UFC5_9BILA|nr:hypothetical protein Y032_0043g769 [Ancylostoma ceylanicum]